jgi:hypothetical protein
MATSVAGGCLCGAVRYECAAEPVMAGTCHCLDCQKSSGAGGAPTLFVPQVAVQITGEVKYYASKGDSGQSVERGFCPNCGSPLFGKPAAMPDMLGIRAGTLDDPSIFTPGMHIYASRAQSWDVMNPDTPQFPQGPEM